MTVAVADVDIQQVQQHTQLVFDILQQVLSLVVDHRRNAVFKLHDAILTLTQRLHQIAGTFLVAVGKLFDARQGSLQLTIQLMQPLADTQHAITEGVTDRAQLVFELVHRITETGQELLALPLHEDGQQLFRQHGAVATIRANGVFPALCTVGFVLPGRDFDPKDRARSRKIFGKYLDIDIGNAAGCLVDQGEPCLVVYLTAHNSATLHAILCRVLVDTDQQGAAQRGVGKSYQIRCLYRLSLALEVNSQPFRQRQQTAGVLTEASIFALHRPIFYQRYSSSLNGSSGCSSCSSSRG